MTLILASTSPYRRALLERLGVEFKCFAPGVDETPLADESPTQTAERLARAKALAVSKIQPDTIIVAADQIVVHDNEVLGKPGSAKAATDQLKRLSGRTHLIITTVCVRRGAEEWQHTDTSQLTMRPLTAAEIERYIMADSPFDCAGAYKLEAHGIALFESIQTADFTAIVGLPLLAVSRILRGLGVELLHPTKS